MFLTNKDRDLTEEQWEKITYEHRQHYYLYLEEFIAPEIIAHYIATGYYQNSIYKESFDLHIRSNLNIINYSFDNID